jgi:hypothetical protein
MRTVTLQIKQVPVVAVAVEDDAPPSEDPRFRDPREDPRVDFCRLSAGKSVSARKLLSGSGKLSSVKLLQ